MSINFLLKRSTTASKRPTAAQLDIGELSLNYDAGTAGVFFEDSAGAVRKIGPAEVSATAPNASPAGSSGNSLGELWYDTAIGNLKIFDGTSFVDATTAGAAGGSDTQVQFNSTGSLAGSANFTFNGTTASIAGLSILGTSRFGLAATQDAIELLGRNGGTSSFRVALRPATLSANRTQDLQNLGGVVALDVNKLSFFAATTSAELAGVISDETGSGLLVFNTSPSLTTPAIGAATGTSLVLTGSNTASSFIPTGSSVPTNGVYLPAANSVGIATNSNERVGIDGSGRLLVGTSSTIASPDTGGTQRNPRIQNAGTVAADALWTNSFFGTGVGSASSIQFTRSNSTTIGGHALAANNNVIGTLQWSASDGSQYIRAAQISASVDGVTGQTAGTFVVGTEYRILTTGTTDFTLIGAADSNPGTIFTATDVGTGTGTAIRTAGDMPGRLVFSTTPDNTGAPVERLRITSTGQATFTTTGTTAAIFNTAINGFIRVTDGTIQTHLQNTGAAGRLSTATDHPLVFATDGTERARITNTGALLVGTAATPTGAGSGAMVAQTRTVIGSTGAGSNQVYAGEIGSITATTGTVVFKFKTTQTAFTRPCFARLAISNRSGTNTVSQHAAAEYAFQLHQTSGTVCTLNGATSIFEFTYVRATHFAFADLGGGECTVTLTNPVAAALTGAYRVELVSPAGFWTLDSVTTT
jgi:hypothetical protein